MPPKGSSSAKPVKADHIKAEPSTPKPKVKAAVAETPKKTPSTSAKRVKAAAPQPEWKKLSGDGAINVRFDGAEQAKALSAGGYSLNLKLSSPNAFCVVKSTILTEGPLAGQHAIIVRPAKPFDFMALPEPARNIVYRMYFAPKGLTEPFTPIVLDGKRSADKAPYSKSYAEGSKNRVALLAVSKQVSAEANPVLYNHPLRFESTTLLGEFLVEYADTRSKILKIEVKAYKKGARTALSMLAESIHLQHLRLEAGVTDNPDPRKAAQAFHLDAIKLLLAIGKQKQSKDAGVDMITFAKGALTTKGDKPKNYTEDMVEQFVECLRKHCN